MLKGIDLGGTIAVVTGGYSGSGLETMRALTRAGAHVVVPGRRPAGTSTTRPSRLVPRPASVLVGRHSSRPTNMVASRRLRAAFPAARGQVKTANASPRLAGMGGVYLEDCDVAGIRTSDDMFAKCVYPYAVDPVSAARLWTLSAELTGVNAFE